MSFSRAVIDFAGEKSTGDSTTIIVLLCLFSEKAYSYRRDGRKSQQSVSQLHTDIVSTVLSERWRKQPLLSDTVRLSAVSAFSRVEQ